VSHLNAENCECPHHSCSEDSNIKKIYRFVILSESEGSSAPEKQAFIAYRRRFFTAFRMTKVKFTGLSSWARAKDLLRQKSRRLLNIGEDSSLRSEWQSKNYRFVILSESERSSAPEKQAFIAYRRRFFTAFRMTKAIFLYFRTAMVSTLTSNGKSARNINNITICITITIPTPGVDAQNCLRSSERILTGRGISRTPYIY